MAEALNGTYKAELVSLHGPWRTRTELETATINWIYWYNERRLHGEIGDMPPEEFETMWYTHNQPASAGTTN
jgi:putative transposase